MKRKNSNPYIIFRITESLKEQIVEDLQRRHGYASERVGFLYIKSKWLDGRTLLLIAASYESVNDKDYIKDPSVGAKISSNAIRPAMQKMIDQKCGCLHVHMHDHFGQPKPSEIDSAGLPGVVESLSNAAADQVTGYMILSKDSFYSSFQVPGYRGLNCGSLVSVVGFPMVFHYSEGKGSKENKIFQRQTFLGEHSQILFENVRIGVVGYGGGGSHIGQQIAHIGIKHSYIFDGDHIEDTNLNRLVGGRKSDLRNKLPKISIAKRMIKSILPSAQITAINGRWQQRPEFLQRCDLVVGCVDSYAERQQLEAECRRYLIPYVDIGMDITVSESLADMSGQVMLSMPASPCFWCFGFLTNEKLGKEAAKYGQLGGRPQVVWPNGVLASTAVGVVVELITGWTGRKKSMVYLEYDGNAGTIQNHVRLRFCEMNCGHYPVEKAGPIYKI